MGYWPTILVVKLSGLWIAARQWIPFALRTVAYGTVSCLLGPLTRDHRASLWAMRQWCISSVRSLGIVVECEGQGNVPVSGAYVYCANHQSLVDILVLGANLPGDYKWAAKSSLMRIPFLGWHLRLAGHVPVDRGHGAGVADEVVERFARVLREDKPLLIFPEGTRTPDGEVKPFKRGAFRAAVSGSSPVVPVALCGTHNMMSKGKLSTGTGAKLVRVRIGEPIRLPSVGSDDERAEVLRQETYAAVQELLAGLRAPGEKSVSNHS